MLPKTMKALVAYGKGDYKYEPAYPVPECGDDDIIIKLNMIIYFGVIIIRFIIIHLS